MPQHSGTRKTRKVPADPVARIRWIDRQLDRHRSEMAKLAALRRQAVRELSDELGPTKAAARLGVSRQTIHKHMGAKS